MFRPLAFLMAISFAVPALGAGRDDATSREDALVQLFAASAFKGWAWPIARDNRTPFETYAALKWQTPIEFEVLHEIGFGYPLSWEDDYERFRTFIADLSLELSRLTGLPITEHHQSDNTHPNAVVHIIGDDNIDAVYAKFDHAGLAHLGTQRFVCNGWPQPDETGVVNHGFMFLRTGLPKELARHCIVKTMLEILGLEGVGGRQQVSRDRIDGQPLYPLSFEVKLMLRALYDPRIRHDMAKTEAMTQARAIIVGLLRIVDQQGEGALYQR